MNDTWRDRAIYTGIGLAFIIGIPLAIWLAWLALTAFLIYGYQAIQWILT